MIDGISDELSSLGLVSREANRDEGLGQEAFLTLMIKQLENQDPFKPLESGEFLGQLAQFGTVQGLAGLQTAFDELAGSLVSNQALQAAGLVGRTALVASSTASLATGGAVEGAVDVPQSAGSVRIQIRGSDGEVVRRLDLGSQPAGLTRFAWDGITDGGVAAQPGRYEVVAEYQLGNSTAAADVLVATPIDSVVFGAGGFSVQLRDLGEMPFSAVREIRSE